jgi:small GTP-binding protein
MISNTYKFVIVGDGAVGKTSLLLAYTNDNFSFNYIPTIFDNYCSHICVDGKYYNINLWDTAGQEEYSRLRSLAYPMTDVFILCYSTISKTSFENIKDHWYKELRHYSPSAPIILVGTKVDLRKIIAEHISYEDGIMKAFEIDAKSFFECSALTRKSIIQIFEDAVRIAESKTKINTNINIKKKKCIIL